MEAGKDLVGDLVGIVLEPLDDSCVQGHAGRATLHAIVEGFGSIEDQVGLLFEQLEELLVTWKQVHVTQQGN
jgi:hypothetical protein